VDCCQQISTVENFDNSKRQLIYKKLTLDVIHRLDDANFLIPQSRMLCGSLSFAHECFCS